jgi:hypothetical protein
MGAGVGVRGDSKAASSRVVAASDDVREAVTLSESKRPGQTNSRAIATGRRIQRENPVDWTVWGSKEDGQNEQSK